MSEVRVKPLPRLPQEFLRITGRTSPPYRKIHTMALDGKLPGEFIGGRWHYREDRLSDIVAILAHLAA